MVPAPFNKSGGDISRIIGHNESRNRDYYGNGNAVVSPKGARFRMQVMPATARDPGYGITPARDNSPAEFNRVGEEYWRAMLKEFNGNFPQMFAAYNAGPGRVQQAIKRGGADWLRYLPAETRNYVQNNMRMLRGS